jgi:hypothetical protein
MSAFSNNGCYAKNLLQYYTSQSSSEIYIQNMKNIHPSLNENNIYGLALLSVNPAIPEEERQIFKKCLELKGKEIQKQLTEKNLPMKNTNIIIKK